MFVVLSISVHTLDSGHPLLADLGLEASVSADIKSLGAKYRSAAMKCLAADHFLWRHNLHTVQALVLLIYPISHAHGPSWALLGATFNISVSIGCHIDPSQLKLDPVRSELRRRCWAGLMSLYAFQNTYLGNIAPMKLTANVCFPADLDDEKISLRNKAQHPVEGSEQKPPSIMSYNLFNFKLFSLASDVHQFARYGGDSNALRELERKISEKGRELESRFEDEQQLRIYHLVHRHILNIYMHSLRLVLYRTYVQPHGSLPDGVMLQPQNHVFQSREHCRMSAMTILRDHETLCCIDDFKPYRWFVYSLGSFQAFVAATILVVLLASEDDVTAPHRIQISEALQSCQARFEQMAARSDLCSKAAAILRRLLPARPATNRDPEPPGLHHHSSGTGAECKMCRSGNGQFANRHVAPTTWIAQPGFEYDGEVANMDPPSVFNFPEPVPNFMGQFPEQWFVGPELEWLAGRMQLDRDCF